MSDSTLENSVLEAIRTRRVVRALTPQSIERGKIDAILKAGRWAPSAGNWRLHRYVAVQDSTNVRLLRMFAPGMIQKPTAIVVICIDWERVAAYGVPPDGKGAYLHIDVGTAAQTMLLAAHSLGLGSGLVTSFSKAAVRVILNLPQRLSPELFICLGYPATVIPPAMSSWGKINWRTLVDWERFPDK